MSNIINRDVNYRRNIMINKNYENIHRYDFLTKELLLKEYVENKLTDREIAKKYNISSKTIIWRKRKKFSIENRYKGKSNQNAKKNRKFNINKEEAELLLKKGNTYNKIAQIMNCSISVARRRFEELGLTKKQNHTSRYKYVDIELNNSQKQLLIGSVLGDGTTTKHGAYSCSHSIKQKEYFNHKRKILNNIHSNCFQRYAHNYPYLKERIESLHFTTGCNKLLYELRNIYYPEGKKIFPYNYLLKNMSEEALAYWYCDDGSYQQYCCYIYTYGYTYEEQVLMQKLFFNKFNIDVDIKEFKEKIRNKKKYYLKMNKENSKNFISLIRPYIIPSMLYKIDYEEYKIWRKKKELLLKESQNKKNLIMSNISK